jgi:hypothetical protein
MDEKILETMDEFKIDMAVQALKAAGIRCSITGRPQVGGEVRYIPMAILKELRVFQEADEKKKKRVYGKMEGHWVKYIIAFLPLVLISRYLLPLKFYFLRLFFCLL